MRQSGLSRQVLYQYTAIGLIREAALNARGHRLFSPEVLTHLELIRELNAMGYTLRDVKEIFLSR